MSQPLIQGALRDENGQGDIAYIAMGGLGLAVLGPVIIMTLLSAYSVYRCTPKEIVVKDTVTIISCAYDPQPLGAAIGLACGGFGVALGALAAYMAATRKTQGSSTTTTRVQETVVAAAPVPAATPEKAIPVVVKNEKPVVVRVAKDARKGKR